MYVLQKVNIDNSSIDHLGQAKYSPKFKVRSVRDKENSNLKSYQVL